MPPRSQAKAQGKAKAAAAKRPSAAKTRRNAQVATSNARRDGRRAALRALNGLAREVGIRQLPHLIAHKASPTPAVDRIMRLLDVRCGDEARAPSESVSRHGFSNCSFSCPSFCLALKVPVRDEMFGTERRARVHAARSKAPLRQQRPRMTSSRPCLAQSRRRCHCVL